MIIRCSTAALRPFNLPSFASNVVVLRPTARSNQIVAQVQRPSGSFPSNCNHFVCAATRIVGCDALLGVPAPAEVVQTESTDQFFLASRRAGNNFLSAKGTSEVIRLTNDSSFSPFDHSARTSPVPLLFHSLTSIEQFQFQFKLGAFGQVQRGRGPGFHQVRVSAPSAALSAALFVLSFTPFTAPMAGLPQQPAGPWRPLACVRPR